MTGSSLSGIHIRFCGLTTLLVLSVKLCFGISSWSEIPAMTTPGINFITFANNMFIAVGENGAITSSSDGYSSWTTRESSTISALRFVTYCGDVFIAVGDTGTIVTSTDGTAWTVVKKDLPINLTSVAWGAGTFVAVGTPSDTSGACILTSSNGTAWVEQHPDSVTQLNTVVFGNNLFVASGLMYVAISTDGVHWDLQRQANGASIAAGTPVGFGNSHFVAQGQMVMLTPDRQPYMARVVKVSTNGTAWSSCLTGTYIPFHYGNQLVAVDYRSVMTSADYTTFTPVCTLSTDTSIYPQTVAYGKGRLVILDTKGSLLTLELEIPTLTLQSRNQKPAAANNSGITVTTRTISIGFPAADLNKQYQAELFSLSGQKIVSTPLRIGNGLMQFDNPGLSEGTYVLSVMQENTVVMSKRFTLKRR
jgi:hypothetical protein